MVKVPMYGGLKEKKEKRGRRGGSLFILNL